MEGEVDFYELVQMSVPEMIKLKEVDAASYLLHLFMSLLYVRSS